MKLKRIFGVSYIFIIVFLSFLLFLTFQTTHIFAGICAAAILFLLLYLSGVFIARSILVPLSNLSNAIAELGKGNLDIKTDDKSNIDELRLLAEAFNKMVAALKARQEVLAQSFKIPVIGQLAGSVAHEINNPLTGVVNNVQLLKMEAQCKADFKMADFKELLDLIEESALRCQKITQSLLDLSRASRGKLERISLNKVIEKVIAGISQEKYFNGVVIQQDIQPDLAQIQGDSNLLGQVIVNLVHNAQWAIQKNNLGEKGFISIKAWQDSAERKVILSVADNGIGISQENLPKLFQPFFTTKAKNEGTGIGLALINNIIRSHNGEINVESEINSGSTFTVKFPYGL